MNVASVYAGEALCSSQVRAKRYRVGRTHDAGLRDESRYQLSRGHIKRRVKSAKAFRAPALVAETADFQRVAPAGGAEPAKAEILASTSAPYWQGLPGRATSRSAYSAPPSRYAARVRQMAVRPTPRTAMIWDSGMPRSSADSMCARLTSLAWRKPFARYDSINARSSSLSRSSVCRIANSSSWNR